jgi:hypothetical protein
VREPLAAFELALRRFRQLRPDGDAQRQLLETDALAPSLMMLSRVTCAC